MVADRCLGQLGFQRNLRLLVSYVDRCYDGLRRPL